MSFKTRPTPWTITAILNRRFPDIFWQTHFLTSKDGKNLYAVKWKPCLASNQSFVPNEEVINVLCEELQEEENRVFIKFWQP